MRLIVTGGGTGGHIFPALEVARFARDRDDLVLYLGSVRGQEGKACEKANIAFQGFRSEPLYSLKTPRGWRVLARMWRASQAAKSALIEAKPDAVFSTGGYSSAPVVLAAKRLGIPFVIHEQNSVPGRTNKFLSNRAYCVATTFESADKHFAVRTVRTGLPVRTELRELCGQRTLDAGVGHGRVLVTGGSQGAASINEAALSTANRMSSRKLKWLNVTGKANFEQLFPSFEKLGLLGVYEMKSYLEGPEMGDEYARSTISVSRSGAGTLSELAAFRLPSVLIPYPWAHANHQLHNAMEFSEIGAAIVIEQKDLHPTRLEEAVAHWIDNAEAIRKAQEALADWDRPDAAERVYQLITKAADRTQ